MPQTLERYPKGTYRDRLERELSQGQQDILARLKSDPLWWFRNCTRTFDQHWYDAGLASPYNPLPDYAYFDYVFDFMRRAPLAFETRNRKVRCLVKSRDLMASWSVVASKTHKAMVLPEQEILLQSQTEEKGYELIGYAKTLWEQQEPWLRAAFPLKRGMRLEDFPKDRIEWENGSRIMALAQGDTKINSYHPTDLVQDEAALQADGSASYGAALPACQNITCLSSAYPGWYEELVEPDYHPHRSPQSFLNPSRGVYIRHTTRGIPVLWLHYSADPTRGPEWKEREKANYQYDSDWEREQEMEFSAGGGELIFAAALREKKDKILITEPGYRANPTSNFYGGFDWGLANPTSFHVYEVNRQGEIIAFLEHYLTDTSPAIHGHLIGEMTINFADGTKRKVLDVIRGIYADPSIFWDMQAQETGGFKALAQMFPERMFRKMVPGQRGQDGTCSLRIKEMWAANPLKFKIVCQGGVPERKQEGTFDWGCPNLLWEMMRLRRAELGASQLMVKNPTEKLVQKHNHAFDDLCYFLTGGMAIPQQTKQEKWAARRRELLEVNPNLDVDSLVIYRNEFEKQLGKSEGLRSWR